MKQARTATFAIPGLIKLTEVSGYHTFRYIAFITLQMQYFIALYLCMYLWSAVVKMVDSTVHVDLRNRFLSKAENSFLKPIGTHNEI